jgi:hypothetical protein
MTRSLRPSVRGAAGGAFDGLVLISEMKDASRYKFKTLKVKGKSI